MVSPDSSNCRLSSLPLLCCELHLPAQPTSSLSQDTCSWEDTDEKRVLMQEFVTLPPRPKPLIPFVPKFQRRGRHSGGMTASPGWRTSSASIFDRSWCCLSPSPFLQLGMIRTKDTDYFLKPLPPHLTSKLDRSAQGGSPSHVLYKRSTERQAPRENEVLMLTRKRDRTRPHLHHDNFPLGLSQKQHFCGRRKKCM